MLKAYPKRYTFFIYPLFNLIISSKTTLYIQYSLANTRYTNIPEQI